MNRQGFIAYYDSLVQLIRKLGLERVDESIAANERRIQHFTVLGDEVQLASLRGTAEILTARKLQAPAYFRARDSLRRMYQRLSDPFHRQYIEPGDESEDQLAEMIATAQNLIAEVRSHDTP